MNAWYEQSFGEDYLIVYKHRDLQGARDEVKRMIDWLELMQGAEILDLCCGMGRHSLALADWGYQVTGVDLSKVLLDEARRLDSANQVNWIIGDMRNVPIQSQFDAVVNLFTSFGYFDTEEENTKVIRQMDRSLKPGGKFIIDFLNPDYVQSHLVPYSERMVGLIKIEETRTIEEGFVRKKIVLREDGVPDRHYREQVKLYKLKDFQSMIEQTGLRIDFIYGNYNETTYEEQLSPRLIIVGHKEGLENEDE